MKEFCDSVAAFFAVVVSIVSVCTAIYLLLKERLKYLAKREKYRLAGLLPPVTVPSTGQGQQPVQLPSQPPLPVIPVSPANIPAPPAFNWEQAFSLVVLGTVGIAFLVLVLFCSGLLPLLDESIAELPGHEKGASCIAYSPDGKLIATGGKWDDHCIYLWDAETHTCIRRITSDFTIFKSVGFSPDGKKLVSACSGGRKDASIWECSTGTCLRVLEHKDHVASAVFSPDGKQVISGCDDHGVRLWDAETGACLRVYKGCETGVREVVISSDGSFVAAAEARCVRVWDKDSGRLLHTLDGLHYPALAFGLSPTDLAAADNKGVHIFDVRTAERKALFTVESESDIGYSLPALAFSKDGTTVVASARSLIHIWDRKTGRYLRSLRAHRGSVSSIAFRPDGLLFASAGDDKIARIWRLR